MLNVYATCGHDSQAAACAVLSPYASLGGGAKIGTRVFMGSHSFIAPKITVGDDCKIAAGAMCFRDVPANSLAMGNPAQSRVMFRPRADDQAAH
jgi:acetyltransferase-like isoleucine patch superfamily enzyme